VSATLLLLQEYVLVLVSKGLFSKGANFYHCRNVHRSHWICHDNAAAQSQSAPCSHKYHQ